MVVGWIERGWENRSVMMTSRATLLDDDSAAVLGRDRRDVSRVDRSHCGVVLRVFWSQVHILSLRVYKL